MEGGEVLSSYDLPDGLSMPSSILLYQEDQEGAAGGAAAVAMDVRCLLDETDTARELRMHLQHQQQGGEGRPAGGGEGRPVAAVRLTRDAVTEILRFHPDDGLRWQVGETVVVVA
jgi:hypothetical protein